MQWIGRAHRLSPKVNDMAVNSATASSSLRAGLLLALVLSLPAWPQAAKQIPQQQLYMLAATPNDAWGYPATLYRVDGGKLGLVRE